MARAATRGVATLGGGQGGGRSGWGGVAKVLVVCAGLSDDIMRRGSPGMRGTLTCVCDSATSVASGGSHPRATHTA
jgi:hypothetical protein